MYVSLLTGYIVEKCDIGTDKWLPVPGYCPAPYFCVKSLHEGKQYRFRVKAENIYGISEGLESKPITAKNPFGNFIYFLLISILFLIKL